jgi:hypothetical protein
MMRLPEESIDWCTSIIPSRNCRVLLAGAAVSIGALTSTAVAQAIVPQEGAVTCSSPIAPKESADSLKQRFGKDAVVQQLPGAEGETHKGLVLFPRSKDRRIEVSFSGEAMKSATGLVVRDGAKTSAWNIAGVSIGSSLTDVQKANGRAFLVAGFDWDYGGYVVDWKGGALGKLQPGGCKVSMRFGKDTGAPDSLMGDSVKASSDDATLRKWGPVVVEFGLRLAPSR